jgi:hypothetical protein
MPRSVIMPDRRETVKQQVSSSTSSSGTVHPNLHLAAILYADACLLRPHLALIHHPSGDHDKAVERSSGGVRPRIRTPPEQHQPCSDADSGQPW